MAADAYDHLCAIGARRKAKALMKKGYRRTSRKHGSLSRIDRPDWKEVLKNRGFSGLGSDAADFYRRCKSEDVITVPRLISDLVKSSSGDRTSYVWTPEDEAKAKMEDVDPGNWGTW